MPAARRPATRSTGLRRGVGTAGLAAAYAEAAVDLPAYLGGQGYFPAGLPVLQAAIARRTTRAGCRPPPSRCSSPPARCRRPRWSRALGGPGDRVVVESPAYPNAVQALTQRGARLVAAPVDPDGWDLDAVASVLRWPRPRAWPT